MAPQARQDSKSKCNLAFRAEGQRDNQLLCRRQGPTPSAGGAAAALASFCSAIWARRYVSASAPSFALWFLRELRVTFLPSLLLLLLLFALILRRCCLCRLRSSIDSRARGLLGGTVLIVLLDGALVEPAGTELLVLRHEMVPLLVLVAAEWRRRLRRGIVGAGYASSLAGGNSNQVVSVLKTLLGIWGRELQRSWVLYGMCILLKQKILLFS